MIHLYQKVKNNLLADNFFSNLFYIGREINGFTFFIAIILRFTLLTFVAETVVNHIIVIPFIFYISLNSLKWRIKAIYGGNGTGTVILSIIWTIALTFCLRYITFSRLYAVIISSLDRSLPFLDQAKLIIQSLAGIHIISFIIFFVSLIVLSLLNRSSGEYLFSVNDKSFYCQRRYFSTYMKIIIFNILFLKVISLLFYIISRSYGYIPESDSFIIKAIFWLWAIVNFAAYLYNTGSRIRDFSVSMPWLWAIFLFFLGSISFISSPLSASISSLIVSRFFGTNELVAFSTFIGPLIDLASRPIYHLVIIIYFILLFVPGTAIKNHESVTTYELM